MVLFFLASREAVLIYEYFMCVIRAELGFKLEQAVLNCKAICFPQAQYQMEILSWIKTIFK